MGWGGIWEESSGWGIHVHPWLIHVNVEQKPLQYCNYPPIKINKLIKKKKKDCFKGKRKSLSYLDIS